MKNEQVTAVRRAINPFRSQVSLDVRQNADGSETLAFSLAAPPHATGTLVTVTRDMAISELTNQLSRSLSALLT